MENSLFESLESNAERAKSMSSFWDYKPGSATEEYNAYCANADEIAAKAKAYLEKHDAPAERAEKVDYLLSSYKAKKLDWLTRLYANRASCPSVMICGPANFPTRKKERQTARENALYKEDPEYILDEIKGIWHNAGTIYSDDENAVDRIKAKIERLTSAPDPYGNKSAEIRRLKERLLQLAPEEFAEQMSNVSVNGAKTYEEILALWDAGKITNHGDRWYFDLAPIVFSDGKRNYREWLNFETDEAGKNRIGYNIQTHTNDAFPLTDEHKYMLIIGRIGGSGNKAVIYKHLKGLIPQAQETVQDDAERAADTVTINGESAEVQRDKDDMRLRLIFDGKPSDETRDKLKANGFKWSPKNTAWQRLLNNNAESALRRIADK